MMDRAVEFLGDWVLTPIMILLITALGIGVVMGIPYGIYKWATYTPPETFELRVDSWQCTKSYERDRQVCTKGCRWVRETVCEQWSAR